MNGAVTGQRPNIRCHVSILAFDPADISCATYFLEILHARWKTICLNFHRDNLWDVIRWNCEPFSLRKSEQKIEKIQAKKFWNYFVLDNSFMGARDPPKSLDPQSSFRRFKVNRGNTFQFLAHKFLSSTDGIQIRHTLQFCFSVPLSMKMTK